MFLGLCKYCGSFRVNVKVHILSAFCAKNVYANFAHIIMIMFTGDLYFVSNKSGHNILRLSLSLWDTCLLSIYLIL